MARKYVKPSMRNLGDIFPNAEGLCWNGSQAHVQPPTQSCYNGHLAQGGWCGTGEGPANLSCDVGTAPQFFGCQSGTGATNPGCITGTSPR